MAARVLATGQVADETVSGVCGDHADVDHQHGHIWFLVKSTQ